MLANVNLKFNALEMNELEKATGGESFMEQMKKFIDQEKENEQNEPFPSFFAGMRPLVQQSYDCVMRYQEKNGIILSDQEAEKRFWNHMAMNHTDE